MCSHGFSISTSGPKAFELIEPEEIAGFVVKKPIVLEYADGSTKTEDRIHTVLTILSHQTDNHRSWKLWYDVTDAHRGDIPALTLGYVGKIKTAPALVIMGNWFEFYHYNCDGHLLPERFSGRTKGYGTERTIVAFSHVEGSQFPGLWNNLICPESLDLVEKGLAHVSKMDTVYQDLSSD